MGVFGRRVMGRDKIIFSYPMFGVRPDRIKLSYLCLVVSRIGYSFPIPYLVQDWIGHLTLVSHKRSDITIQPRS